MYRWKLFANWEPDVNNKLCLEKIWALPVPDMPVTRKDSAATSVHIHKHHERLKQGEAQEYSAMEAGRAEYCWMPVTTFFKGLVCCI